MPMAANDFISAAIRELRLEAGMSVAALGKELGVNRISIYRFENPDDVLRPSPVSLFKLGRLALRVNRKDLGLVFLKPCAEALGASIEDVEYAASDRRVAA